MVHPDRPNPFWLLTLLVAGVTCWVVHRSPPSVEVATVNGCDVPGTPRKAAEQT
jgi:hypothetical protein